MEIALNTDFYIPYRPIEDKTKRDLEKTIRESNSLLERHHEKMKSAHEPIVLNYLEGQKVKVFYLDSKILTRLKYYPFVQLIIISVFLIIS